MSPHIVRLAACALVASATSVAAAPIAPTFQTFGDLPGATFNGTDIPTDPTAFSSFTLANGQTLTLGIAITPRFQNPAVGNDGNGTYFVGLGFNDGVPGSMSGTNGGVWNFSTFIELSGAANPGEEEIDLLDVSLDLELLYDFDPGADTDEADLGRIDIALALQEQAALLGGPLPPDFFLLSQGSQNPAFQFLAGIPPIGSITPPPGNFDPFAPGEYTFALVSSAGTVAVNAVAVVPVPAGLPLALAAFGMLGLVARRRNYA
ncbi:MAG: hypothetical protein AAF416_08070 [Pseudomonadota bacterium]